MITKIPHIKLCGIMLNLCLERKYPCIYVKNYLKINNIYLQPKQLYKKAIDRILKSRMNEIIKT